MPWFRIDDDAAFNRKVLAAGNDGFGAFARMGAWTMKNLTDGLIPLDVAVLIAGSKRLLERLVTVGLLESDGGDFRIHDHLDRNPSAEQVKQKAAARAEAGRQGGKQSGASRRSNSVSKNEANASENASPNAQANDQAKTNPNPIPNPKENQIALSRAPARMWSDADFRATWERVTEKSGMAPAAMLIAAAELVRDSARVAGRDVGEYAEAIIGAFPRVLAWLKRSQLHAPALGVAAFIEPKHYARCEDVVAGRLNPDEEIQERPARGGGTARGSKPEDHPRRQYQSAEDYAAAQKRAAEGGE